MRTTGPCTSRLRVQLGAPGAADAVHRPDAAVLLEVRCRRRVPVLGVDDGCAGVLRRADELALTGVTMSSPPCDVQPAAGVGEVVLDVDDEQRGRCVVAPMACSLGHVGHRAPRTSWGWPARPGERQTLPRQGREHPLQVRAGLARGSVRRAARRPGPVDRAAHGRPRAPTAAPCDRTTSSVAVPVARWRRTAVLRPPWVDLVLRALGDRPARRPRRACRRSRPSGRPSR